MGAVVAVGCVVSVLATGCSSFPRQWKSAASAPAPAADPGGAWEGTWQSARSGFGGRLRCVVDANPRGEAAAKVGVPFVYHATWHGGLSGTFRTRQPLFRVAAREWTSSGAWKLPFWAGGTYKYEVRLSPERFTGTYEGGGDRGTIDMHRPAR